ncbi:MAG: IS91 family transposase, partial [Gammaproteobacteria bacterium]|nr:IS91 family transposase [Gammaproteobacteria bacterium]
EELLPVPYFHIVFTLPHTLNPLAQGNPALIYNLLFQAASATLLQFARDPKWLGAEPAITMVLHTWGQNLNQHIHLHCIVSGGGLTPDGEWKESGKTFFAPVKAMSKVFRGKFLDGLKQAYAKGELHFSGGTADLADPQNFQALTDKLYGQAWAVYAKRPFAGPKQVLKYLSRYTHRTAIGNSRIISFDGQHVRFRYKDYRDNGESKIMTLEADEFLRRFLLHIPPSGFMRIRHYGLLANRCKAAKLARCREILKLPEPESREPESAAEFLLRTQGIDIYLCPACKKGRLHPAGPLPENHATGPP